MQFAEKIVDQALRVTGSTWITERDLKKQMTRTNRGTMNDISHGLKDKVLVSYKINGETAYSTRHFNEAENDVAVNIMRIQFVVPSKTYPDALVDNLIDEFEKSKNHGRQLHIHQRDAVKMVCSNNFSVLTGGPGTGKTTVLSAITYCLRALTERVNIVFTAPTGKAARRISESTGECASTVHKKLGIGHQNNENDAEMFFEDVLFIDESSMNDTELMSVMTKCIPNGRKVVLVGDVNQLPSIGPGAVLRDLITSGVIPVTMLTHTFRQDNHSMLFTNICNIRDGKPEFIPGDDFHTILLPPGKQGDAAMKQIKDAYLQSVQKYGRDQVVVLLPYRKKGVCSNKINSQLQLLANTNRAGYRHYNHADRNTLFFMADDYVMQLENREECANGDVGKVLCASEAGITVQYTDGVVTYTPSELDQLALAYSMTIHKSQGSEYKSVIMCFLNEHKAMLQRNLLYTGITRAKTECTVIYQQEALETACATVADAFRLTMLKEKLQDIRAQYKIVYGI